MDLKELNNKIPGYLKRKNSKQPEVDYSLNIFVKKTTYHTKATKKRKAMTTVEYERVNSNKKGYKNLEWLNRMYDKKVKASEEENCEYYKVILPIGDLPNKYKFYDKNGDYYGTILEQDDIFYYTAVKKDEHITPFLKTFIDKMFIQGQCDNKRKNYGLTIPYEFYKDYNRKD